MAPGESATQTAPAEELLAQRFLLDPEAEPLRVQELDRERTQLLQQEIPKFEQVIQRVNGQEQAAEGR
jgi:hypothetical protein